MGVNIMKGLITSLVVLAVLTVMAIPTYGKGKGVSKLKVIDANGLVLGSVVGIAGGGQIAEVETTVGGELVILHVSENKVVGTNVGNLRFKDDDCEGQGFLTDSGLIITMVAGADSSVYKVLDRDPGRLESFIVESILNSPPGECSNEDFDSTNMLPATRLGDLSEFTPPFRYLE